jgi:hypothetical protein
VSAQSPASRPRKGEFTDLLDRPEDILEEPSFLSYTRRFWEAPDGELYFRPWREFLLVPGHRSSFRIDGAEDVRLVFNLLKLRNVLAFTLLFGLIALELAMVATGTLPLQAIWPDAVAALALLLGGFAVGLVPINLWCLLLFFRQTRRRKANR